MVLESGYEMKSTFIMDFRIADCFGLDAVKDTYKRAFAEWKGDYVYLTELVYSLNNLCWYHYYEGNTALSELYAELYYKADGYALDTLKDEELSFFLEVTR